MKATEMLICLVLTMAMFIPLLLGPQRPGSGMTTAQAAPAKTLDKPRATASRGYLNSPGGSAAMAILSSLIATSVVGAKRPYSQT